MFGAQIHMIIMWWRLFDSSYSIFFHCKLIIEGGGRDMTQVYDYYVCPLYLVCHDTLPAAVDVDTHKW